MITVSAPVSLVADAVVDRAAGQVGRRQRAAGGQHQRDEHERHAPAVGPQQRQQLAELARAPALARRSPAASQARHLGLLGLAVEERPARAARARRSRGTARTSSSSSSCVPRAATRPSSSTTISSASEIVDRRWAITNVVRPSITSPQRLLDPALGGGVHAGGGVVQDQDARVGQQRPGDRHALALAAATGSARARRPASRSRRAGPATSSCQPGARGGLAHLVVAGVRARVGDVLAQRGGEQEGVVGHQRDLAAQRRRGPRRARRRRRSAPRPGRRRTGAGSASPAWSCPSRWRRPAATVCPAPRPGRCRAAPARRPRRSRRSRRAAPPARRRAAAPALRRAPSARARGRGSRTRARPRPPLAGPCRATTPSMRIGRGEHHHVAVEGHELAERDRAVDRPGGRPRAGSPPARAGAGSR